MKRPLLIINSLLILLPAVSQKREQVDEETVYPKYWTVGIFYDQDYTLEMIGLKTLNEDRNYTLGLGLYYSESSLQNLFLFKPHYWLNRIFRKTFLNSRVSIPAVMLGNGSFTPDSLTAYDVIRNDRPYSSLTYIQTLKTYVDNERYRTFTSTLSLGVIGTYIAREVQTVIHNTMNENDTKNPHTPRGWNNQISGSGEPTLSYSFRKEKLLTKKFIQDEQTSVTGFEFKHAWRYSLGYYTSFNYELDFRLGKIDPRNWTYMINPLSQSNKLQFSDSSLKTGDDRTNYFERKKSFELYLFGSVRPNFILYNALLNGQFRKSPHTLSFQDMRHLVLEFDSGIASNIMLGSNKSLEIKLKVSGRSPEFKLPGRTPRTHYWGGLEILLSRYK